MPLALLGEVSRLCWRLGLRRLGLDKWFRVGGRAPRTDQPCDWCQRVQLTAMHEVWCQRWPLVYRRISSSMPRS